MLYNYVIFIVEVSILKKIYMFILIIIVCVFISGCDGNVTRAVRHAGFNIDGDFKCDVVMPILDI